MMTGYQFVHVETFGRSAPAVAKDARWTVRQVIAELQREPHACSHVAEPHDPEVLYGDNPRDVERELMDAAAAARDLRGRKLRKDAQILMAGIASYPRQQEALSPAQWSHYLAWEAGTIQWLNEQFGQRLRSVVRHTDEGNPPHIHFLVAPDLVGGERVEDLHPGRAAVAAAKRSGAQSKAALDRRYRDAMRAWQDDYWRKVGSVSGLTRLGPGRRRLSRAAWQAEKAAAINSAAIAADRRALEAENSELRMEVRQLRLRLEDLKRQAVVLVGGILDPLHAILSQRPEWLSPTMWQRILKLRSTMTPDRDRESINPAMKRDNSMAGAVLDRL